MSKTRIALSAIAFTLASGAALAQEAVPATWNDSYTPNTAVVASGKTRAEVKAELQAARQAGEVDRYDADSYVPTPVNRGFAARNTSPAPVAAAQKGDDATRARVKAELQAARSSGALNPFDADPYVNVSAHVPAVERPTAVAVR